jgi:hypothetical protein
VDALANLVEAEIGLAVPGRPIQSLVAEDRSAEPVWKKKASWYMVTTEDMMIPPPPQRFMSERAARQSSR